MNIFGGSHVLPDDNSLKGYRLIEHLGDGAFGKVFKAQDKNNKDRLVAIKVLNPLLRNPEKKLARFRREFDSIKSLNGHPNIVKVYSLDHYRDYYYMVMEYIPSISLDKLLEEGKKHPLLETVKIGILIAYALRDAHRKGIIHRDIKPANILIKKKHPVGGVTLIDFSLAKVFDSELTLTDEFIGTALYMAPEQFGPNDKPNSNISHYTDIYSLALVLYRLAAGRLPIESNNLMEIGYARLTKKPEPPITFNNEIPKSLNYVIMKCLEREPKNRYTSCRDLILELSTVIDCTKEELIEEAILEAKKESCFVPKACPNCGGFRRFVGPNQSPPLVCLSCGNQFTGYDEDIESQW